MYSKSFRRMRYRILSMIVSVLMVVELIPQAAWAKVYTDSGYTSELTAGSVLDSGDEFYWSYQSGETINSHSVNYEYGCKIIYETDTGYTLDTEPETEFVPYGGYGNAFYLETPSFFMNQVIELFNLQDGEDEFLKLYSDSKWYCSSVDVINTVYVPAEVDPFDGVACVTLQLIPRETVSENAVFSAESENGGRLTGLEAGTYHLSGDALADGPVDITVANDNAEPQLTNIGMGNLSIVRKGSLTANPPKDDSAELTIYITKAGEPSGLTVVPCSREGAEDAKITGLDPDMAYQYKLSGSSEWINVEENAYEITGLDAGTYDVRVAALGSVLASDAVRLETAMSAEDVSGIEFIATGYSSGEVVGLAEDGIYDLSGLKNMTNISGVSIAYPLDDLITGTLTVTRKGNGTTTSDGVVSFTVGRQERPTDLTGKACTTAANDDGKIEGCADDKEYEYRAAGSSGDYMGLTGNTTLNAGDYYVRVKAAGLLLSSEDALVTIGAYSSGNEDTPEYSIETSGCEHGSVTASVNGQQVTQAAENDSVILTVTPEESYILAENGLIVSYTNAQGETQNVELSQSEEVDKWIFTMPSADVTATAVFVRTALSWTDLQAALDAGRTIVLTQDLTAEAEDSYLNIPSGKTVTLDLNGKTLSRGLTEAREDGNVVTVEGSLTLIDSSSGKTGKITGGYNTDDGGGIIVNTDGNLTVNSGEISGNTADDGGGIYVDKGDLTLNGGIIRNNNCDDEGGGVFINNDNSTFIMNEGAVISGNTADRGAGVSVDGGTFQLRGGSITDNHTNENDVYQYDGGGVYLIRGTFTMEGGSITNNTARHNGGGVYSSDAFTLSGGSISGNTADERGGGVYGESDITMTGGSIASNSAGDYGGGVYITDYSELVMTSSSITGNTADEDGGGVYLDDHSSFTMNSGSIINNTSEINGGGVFLNDDSSFTMISGSISDNSSESGSGVAVYGESDFTLNGGEISDNKGGIYGGGVYSYNGNITLQGGVISNNEVDYQGAGVHIGGNATLTITNTSITGNRIINSDKEEDAFGAGVYIDQRNPSVTLKLSGSPVITGNTSDKGVSNVYLPNGNLITIVSQLSSGASVGMNMNTPGIFTTGYKTYNEGSEPSTYFSGDSNSYIVGLDDNGEAKLVSAAEAFGTPDFTLPTGVGTIEANAFEGLKKMTVVDAQNCTKIGAEAFKGTGLKQIRLDGNCEIHTDAFKNLVKVYVFAPAGGKTEAFCNTHDNAELVSNGKTILESTTTGGGTAYPFAPGTLISNPVGLLP